MNIWRLIKYVHRNCTVFNIRSAADPFAPQHHTLAHISNGANKQLAPRVKGNAAFIEGLEHAMALLIFPRDKLPATLKPLLEPSLRLEIAKIVNAAILTSQGCRKEAAIHNLIKARTWAENKCHEMKKPIPHRLNLGLRAGEDEESNPDDGDAMVT